MNTVRKLSITEPLQLPSRETLPETIHPSLFDREGVTDLKNANFKVFEWSQPGNPNPEKQERKSFLSLLHDEGPLFRSDVSLQLKREGHIAQHPQDPITALLIVGMDDPFDIEVFDIKFMLPENIKFPNYKDVVDTRLTQFLIKNLINPVQNF
jgi:hypothetical protein